jgi:hypothetical protein
MSITRPMLEIDKFLRLADPDRTSRFRKDLEKIFKEVEILRTALVHSQIMSVVSLDKVSVITYSSRQALESSLTSGVVEYMSYSDSELRVEVF